MSEKELHPGKDFDVNNAVLGRSTDFYRHLPVHKEDVFTLIHQNLLACIKAMLSKEIPKDIVLPPLMSGAISKVQSALPGIQILGLEFTDKQVIYSYNYPLRNHSATFNLIYDKDSQDCTIEVQFLGPARQRWALINDFVKLIDESSILKLKQAPEWDENSLKFAWRLTSTKDIDRSIKELEGIADYTMLYVSPESRFATIFRQRLQEANQIPIVVDALCRNIDLWIKHDDEFLIPFEKDMIDRMGLEATKMPLQLF